MPDEDQGYLFLNLQLPLAASLQRTAAVNDKIDAILKETPGVKYYTGVAGFSLLSFASTTYNAFYFITLEDWDERDKHGLTADVIMRDLNRRLAGFPEAQAFAFSPPVIPGIGTSGGVTFMLQDRAGRDPAFLAENTATFLEAARQRPEFALLFTTLLPSVPQLFADVDRDKVLKQGIDLASVYQTLQAFMGGAFVNYFNRFGRVWQVYVQAEGDVPHQGRERRPVLRAELAGECGAAVDVGDHEGQLRTGVHRPVQRVPGGADQRRPGPRRQHPAGHAGAGGGVRPDHAAGHGLQLLGDVVPGAGGRPGGAGERDLRLLGGGGVLAHGRPVRELDAAVRRPARHAHRHWRLPGALWLRHSELDVFSQIGLLMVIGLAAKNAILIVEFAKVAYERGMSLVDAALEGVRVRRRALFMTSFAFILGCVPLWTAVGAGAVGRRILGTVVIGGMLADTLIASLFISVSFYVSERFSRRPPKGEGRPADGVAAGAGGDRGGSPDRPGEPVTTPVRAEGAPGDSPHTGAHP